jgi:hypothetical protein
MRHNKAFLDKSVDNSKRLLERIRATLPDAGLLVGCKFLHEPSCDRRPCWCNVRLVLRDGTVVS